MSSTERGFSLVELVITIAVLAIALLFVVQGIKLGGEQGNSALWQAKTVELANALMDEIHSKRYDEQTPVGGEPCRDPSLVSSLALCSSSLGPDTGENDRRDYDDVDDYHGFSSRVDQLITLAGSGSPTDLNVARNYAGYRVSIVVDYVGSAFGRPHQDLKRVTLTLLPPAKDTSVAFSSIRGNY